MDTPGMGMLTVAEPYLTSSYLVAGTLLVSMLCYSVYEVLRNQKILVSAQLLKNSNQQVKR